MTLRVLTFGAVFVLAVLAHAPVFAQAANWQVTIIDATSEGETVCSNASATFTIPAPTGSVQGTLCGVTATLTVQTQSVTLALTGQRNYQGCLWNITTPISGTGFISGNAVPATSMTGTARTTCQGGTFTNAVSARFQAQRTIAGGGGPLVTNFTGTVRVTVPGQAPFDLNAQNAAGLTLPAGARIQVGAGSTLTLAFAGGTVRLSENTRFVVATQRFFLLVPPFHPLRGGFMDITWSCIPVPEGCVSMATPNARYAFLPPIGSSSEIAPRAGEETATFTTSYTETGGLGTSTISVQAGRVRVDSFRGSSTVVSAGEQRRVVSLAAGAAPLDLNGDVAPDVFRYSAATGAWNQELGDGASASGVWSPDWTVAPGDFDGDGLTDFLLTNSATGSARLALNNGQGGFNEIPVSLSAASGWRAYVANLNGDRLSDALLYQSSTGQWIQVINQGSGTLQEYRGQWTAGSSIQLAELNGDGKADVLLFHPTSGRWQWALNDGAGRFTSTASGESAGSTSVHPGDFNADGLWDALFYSSRTGAWSLATNTGSSFSMASGTAPAGREVVVGDTDADGDTDALLYDSGSGQWSLFVSSGSRLAAGATGSWAARWNVSAADFNTDGRADYFLYAPEGGMWARALNAGSGGFTLQEGVWNSGLAIVSGQTLTQGLQPNDVARASCAAEPGLASAGSVSNHSIEFLNASGQPRQVHWLDGVGRRVRYRTLQPGEHYVQRSSLADVWVVTDGMGRCEGIYLNGAAVSRATLR